MAGWTPFGPAAFPWWNPADDGFLGGNSDPATASGGGLLVAGTLYMARLPVRNPSAITNLWPGLSVLGSDTGTGSFFAGVYSPGGLLLSGSANLVGTVNQGGSTGYKQMALTTAQAQAGGPGPSSWVWAGFLANLTTTQPTFERQLNAVLNSPQAVATPATQRWGAFAAVGTSLPASLTMSSMAATAFPLIVLWN